jgi:penicillin amidase
MERDTGGVFRIRGRDLNDAMRQLGAAHATDRPAQMALMRILATGRATECLADEPDLLEVDRFFRWVGLHRGAAEQAARLRDRERAAVEAYCEGVNAAMARRRKPMPFRVWGYRWEPWQPCDVVMLVRLMSWVGLVSAQVNVEKAIVEMVQAGTDGPRLLELMSPGLDGCDFDLLKQVKLVNRITPAVTEAGGKIGTMAASNNWVVAPSKSTSGRALLANDMHLEVNRLPSVWYEVILELKDDYLMGTTVPGLPGIVTGRNSRLAWGITYTEADTTDFFVEDCRDGRYLKDGEWKKFEKITETIRRRKHDPDTVEVYRNGHGLLLGDAAKEGKYLCMAWTARHCEVADVLEAMYSIDLGRSVEEGMRAVEKFHYPSLNWVFADRDGNIGYKMGGLFPVRRSGWSGLYPVAGWTSENDWQGFVPASDLPSAYNPSEGFFATANQDLGAYGKAAVQNCPMNVHRDGRIRQRLAEKEKLDIDDMKSIQLDIYSSKVKGLAPIFLEAMPDGPAKSMLLEWNYEFDPWSSAATLFEDLYRRALTAVFCSGEGAVPEPMFLHLKDESSVCLNLDLFLERTLLREESLWFNGRTRGDILREAFADMDGGSWPAWGTVNRITMVNIFFGGKLPGFLGMDRGPFAMPGSTDTPRQGSVYRDAGRDTSFCPSNRFITDLGTDEAHTVIPGGPSEKRFSGLYVTDVESWLSGGYKILKGK